MMIRSIINSFTHSFFRTIGRILAYVLLGALVAMLLSSKVDAATYTTESNQITATFDNTAYNRANMESGKTYYHGDKISSSIGFNSYTEIIISDTEDHIDGIFPGTYLIDFYVYGDGTITQNLSCDNINSNFGYYDTITGNLVTTSSKISSKCLEVYNSRYNTINAVKVLMQFTFNGDFAHELKLVITNNNYFIRNTNYFGVFIGNIYDYDQSIVELFHQNALEDMQINQNQQIIDENKQNTDNIINNQNQNASDIMNNQNQNTTDIMDNQNSNTDKVLDSNKETQDKLDENKEAINDMKDSINSNLDDKFNSCRDSYNLLNLTDGTKTFNGITFSYSSGTGSFVGTASNESNVVSAIGLNRYANYIDYGTISSDRAFLLKPGTYTVSISSSNSKTNGQSFVLVIGDLNQNIRTGAVGYFLNGNNKSHTFTLTESKYVMPAYYLYGSSTEAIYFNGIMLNEGSTAKEYEPYGEEICTNKLDEQTEQQKETNFSLKTLIGFLNPFSENFFAYKLVELFLNMLKSLFIPEDMSFVTEFVDALESKLGFIAAIPVKIIEFTMSLATATWSEFNSITFPSISIFGYNFWNTQEIDLTEAINIFKPFKYVTDCICVVICARTLNKWRERFTGSGGGK